MTTKKKPDPDPLVWRGSWATRPLAWCAIAWMAGALLWRWQVPLHWIVLSAIAASIAAPIVATLLDEPLRGRWFYWALFTGLGVYVTWLAADGPLQRDAFLAWVPGGAAFGSWWWWIRHAAELDRRRGNNKQAAARQAAERGMWVDMIERVLKPKQEPGWSGLTEISRTPFPAGAVYGSTIRIGLPRDGSITYTRLEGLVDQLRTAANARKGSILFEEDEELGAEVLLHVMEKDALTETHPLPFDRGPKSVNDEFELGRYADGQVCVLTFREVAAMLVGTKGQGKSSLINTILSHLTGCTDAVVWMIDLKGGETVRPWLEEFLALTTGRPAVDWAAITEDEADAMLIAFKAAISGRGRKRGRFKPSPDRPAIILIVEESSLVTGVGKYGNIERAGLLQDGINTGRSVCCDALVCSQRATVTMLGNGDMVTNLDVRIGMAVADRAEAARIMPDSIWAAVLARLPLRSKPHRGAFVMQAEGSRLMPAKAYYPDPETIPGIARTNASHRADVDPETVEMIEAALAKVGVPGGYAMRWDRLRKVLAYASHGPSHETPQDSPAPVSPASHDGGGETAPGARGARLVQEAIDKGRADRDRLKFEQIMGFNGLGETAVETPGETPVVGPADAAWAGLPETVPPILGVLLAVFAARGNPDALPSQLLCDELPGEMNTTALGRLMAHCNVARTDSITYDGKRLRGWERDAIETAVKRGSFNAQAFDWRP
jgi:hypothetical protein